MNGSIMLGLVSSLFGGLCVALVTYLTTRKRTAAETRKLEAETEHIRIETTKIFLETKALPGFASAEGRLLTGWVLSESDPGKYEIGIDRTVRGRHSPAGYVRSRPNASGFGTLMQMVKAESYRGKRVRLSAYVKTTGPDASSIGLWIRVNGHKGEVLLFDNMENRRIRGTTRWTQHHVVSDVPEQARYIAFGLLLEGSGEARISDMDLEVVGADIAATAAELLDDGEFPDSPVNLDFNVD
ncbi:hypothetical protein GFY24_35355 [Nocardia sp. SYP-A9097]|uniref:hypothetical protein n=1 Tax=Nocardia sp. SYP-A9097 TaxID=2663237 RepID=UPI00129BF702|nr:hypothetical protein [Nocardia sp. SYP-A9097]MRH92640.1 hypothetical protein [Nocardia sp. SYP-A9097]